MNEKHIHRLKTTLQQLANKKVANLTLIFAYLTKLKNTLFAHIPAVYELR